MQAWVAGATGLVGTALVEQLLGDPRVQRVTTLVRRPSHRANPKLVERLVDFEKLAAELQGENATHVFCCLGTTIGKAGSESAFRRVDHDYPLALGRVAKAAGARQFLLVSAMGANPSSRVFYNRVKGEVELDVGALGLGRLDVFRPSLLLGERAEHRPGERLAIALSAPLGKLLVGPLRKYRPIRAADVARAMIRVAESSDAPVAGGVHVYESDQIAALAGADSAC